MKYTTPEKMGIKSSDIKEYLETLEKHELSTHDVIIARHGEIVFETYWEPFKKDDLHRMYSVTKSFVSIAVGFLYQDGKIDLDDPIIKYFPEETKNLKDENMRRQTIRNMLMMSTSKVLTNWFRDKCADRVAHYFVNDPEKSRPAGVTFEYDSEASFVLGAMVERVTGMELMDYLREKLFDKIGVSKEAYMLKCPGGHSWGDSALICKPTDLLRSAQFMLNGGSWNGEQILDAEYVRLATTKQIANDLWGQYSHSTRGYGYQFWMCYGKSFWFNGMGVQVALCVPEKDMVIVVNSDDEGVSNAKDIVVNNLFEKIIDRVVDEEIEDSGSAELAEYCKTLKLATAVGDTSSEFSKKIDGVTFKMNKNPMGITKFKLDFTEDGGVFSYTNEQGDKELPFKMCENMIYQFPQWGYSDEVGGMLGNRLYRCAVSAAWHDEHQLFIKVQAIDTYFGRLNIRIAFNENLDVVVDMNNYAEDFFNEYEGRASGRPE